MRKSKVPEEQRAPYFKAKEVAEFAKVQMEELPDIVQRAGLKVVWTPAGQARFLKVEVWRTDFANLPPLPSKPPPPPSTPRVIPRGETFLRGYSKNLASLENTIRYTTTFQPNAPKTVPKESKNST